MKIKFILIGLTALSSMLLVGCTEENMAIETSQAVESETNTESPSIVSQTADERIYDMLPDNVKNGTVSEDVYLEVTRYITSFAEYDTKLTGFQKRVNSDRSLLEDSTFTNEYKDSLDQYDVFIKEFHLSPVTDADFEINKNFSEMLTYTSYMTSGIRDYIDTGESYHTQNASKEFNSKKTSYMALLNTLEKYRLPKESYQTVHIFLYMSSIM